jgi:hypothetical protein
MEDQKFKHYEEGVQQTVLSFPENGFEEPSYNWVYRMCGNGEKYRCPNF